MTGAKDGLADHDYDDDVRTMLRALKSAIAQGERDV